MRGGGMRPLEPNKLNVAVMQQRSELGIQVPVLHDVVV